MKKAKKNLFVIRKTEINHGDRRFVWLLRAFGSGCVLILVGIIYELTKLALLSAQKFGFSFFYGTDWNPVENSFGALPFVYGTVVSSFLGLLLALPISVGIALFLTEVVSKRISGILGFLVEMLAAIPSVVYGLWGVFVLAPWLRENIQPWLSEKMGSFPLFSGPPFGIGMMCAGVILGIMITPTISAICREVFRTIPAHQKEAALALGATRWEMMRLTVIKSSLGGILGAAILGLGRALGETMAVAMVIGNRHEISASLFSPSATMASVIANEYAEATSDLHLSALAYIGVSLFLVSFLINLTARFMIWRVERKLSGGR